MNPLRCSSHPGQLLGLAFVGLWTLFAASAVLAGSGLPNVELTTHEGETVRFYDDLVKDKVVAINFIYTTCGDSCPAETAKLREVHAQLGDRVGRDIFMYSISIDPEHDTPQVLKEYAERYRIGAGWTFLTGDEQDIILLRKRLGLYMDELDQELGDHNITMIVGNDRIGKWIRRSPFDNPKMLANLIGYELFDGMRPRQGKSYANAPEVAPESRGAYLYRTRCSSCHSIGGGDDPLGPDLAGVTQHRDPDWLKRWLAEPDRMLEEGDPIALELLERYDGIVMPNLRLDEEDVAALIDFMEREGQRALRVAQQGRDRHADHHGAHAHSDHHHHAAEASGHP